MKALGIFSWDRIRDWLAEAGSAAGGFHVEYRDLRASRPQLLPRRRFDRPGRAVKAEPVGRLAASSHEF